MMRFAGLVWKQVVRRMTRTILTAGGVATSMALFCGVRAMQAGVEEATGSARRETTLVVYREDRYCPFASRLPGYYEDRIRRVEGVASVVPMRIVVNNCRAALDVVTFRGVPEEQIDEIARGFTFVDGSLEEWGKRSDAAIVGHDLARRRGVGVGDNLSAAGLTVYVAGVVKSEAAQDWNVAYTRLEFLQRAASVAARGGDAIVTQFNVKVTDPDRIEEVAREIDEELQGEPEPTYTQPERAFVARAAEDVVALAGFMGWLGWGSLAAVGAIVANAIILSVRDRVREHAVLQALGYSGWGIAGLILAEGVIVSALGGGVGTAAALAGLAAWPVSLSTDGVSLSIRPTLGMVGVGMVLSVGLGVAAGLVPAWMAGRREIAESFRAI